MGEDKKVILDDIAEILSEDFRTAVEYDFDDFSVSIRTKLSGAIIGWIKILDGEVAFCPTTHIKDIVINNLETPVIFNLSDPDSINNVVQETLKYKDAELPADRSRLLGLNE